VDHPLSPPKDPTLLARFERLYALATLPDPVARLRQTVQAFSRLPYENLTKILKLAEAGAPARARRGPAEVIGDHERFSTGGTCFSLTAALLHLVRALGFRAWPILADRRYGPDTHCAVLVEIDGRPHLLDPGFLLDRPVPLPRQGPVDVQGAARRLWLEPSADGRRVELVSRAGGRREVRLSFKAEPADEADFLRAWDESFYWDAMRYPVVTAVRAGRHLYLQGNRLQERAAGTVHKSEIDPAEIASRLRREFGIAPEVARRALSVLRRAGERHG
jgi:arylamine N-acetyltransferase